MSGSSDMAVRPTHTSGPWRIDYQPDDLDSKQSILRIVDGSEASLSHPQGPLTIANLNVCAFAPHMDEPLANARLMASAPELLAALEKLLSVRHDPMGLKASIAFREAYEVIAKAKGNP